MGPEELDEYDKVRAADMDDSRPVYAPRVKPRMPACPTCGAEFRFRHPHQAESMTCQWCGVTLVRPGES